VTTRVVQSVRDIDAASWNGLANPVGRTYNPFIDHAFLSALEKSGSATRATGWLGHHLVIEDANGICGLLPCYVKSHSSGEYVFDHGWAEAYERAGGRYYPKLQASVPFTPVTGRRLLARAGPDEIAFKRELLRAARETCVGRGLSSLHITFLTGDESELAGQEGYLKRNDIQFHWLNDGYASFAEFLARLSSAKRKNIRRERESVRSLGVEFEWLTGTDIIERHWDAFFDFYMETGSRKWGSPYLKRKFFSMIGESMAQRILLILCRRGTKYIAGALNFIGGDTLYGRNWGATEHHQFLHFETCYYQAIDYAISAKLGCVEAGAQGPHKLSRGYLPRTTHSAHCFTDPRLGWAVADYLRHERLAVEDDQGLLAEHSPFRNSS
jgi:predicted N-acyltransferase